jgi:uncharacterized protein (TIGR03435 family)
MKKLLTSVFTLVLPWIGVAHAQTPPSFVVATIKLAPPEAQGMRIGSPGPGRFTMVNMTLQGMIGFAWGGTGGTMQVSGGPNWMDKDRFNVEAQAEGQPSMNDMRLMLRSLLIERFALKTHNTSKEIDVYNMVLARADKKLGPKVTDWDGKCGGREPPPAAPGNPRCSAFFRPPGLVMVGVSMSVLANMLGGQLTGLGRPVVDKTGLTGEYNMELEYKFPPPPGAPGAAAPAPASDDPFAPSLFTAVQEQLGVKLQAGKGTADVLVVDQANHPTEN